MQDRWYILFLISVITPTSQRTPYFVNEASEKLQNLTFYLPCSVIRCHMKPSSQKKRREADVPIRALEQSQENIVVFIPLFEMRLCLPSAAASTLSFCIFCPFFLLLVLFLLCTPPCLCFYIIPSSSFVVLRHSFFSALFPRRPPHHLLSSQPLSLSLYQTMTCPHSESYLWKNQRRGDDVIVVLDGTGADGSGGVLCNWPH